MPSFDYKAVTTIAVAMSIISYILTLIRRSQPNFNYAVTTTDGGVLSFITGFFIGALSGIYTALLGIIGSITGMPEWFNALFTVPVSIIILMYLINKA